MTFSKQYRVVKTQSKSQNIVVYNYQLRDPGLQQHFETSALSFYNPVLEKGYIKNKDDGL